MTRGIVAVSQLVVKKRIKEESISLTPSLLQHVKCPGWKTLGLACKDCIVRSYTTYTFNAMRFDEKSFHVPVRKSRQKCWRLLNFVLLLVVFKWRRGSEGVTAGEMTLEMPCVFPVFKYRSVFSFCPGIRIAPSRVCLALQQCCCVSCSINSGERQDGKKSQTKEVKFAPRQKWRIKEQSVE